MVSKDWSVMIPVSWPNVSASCIPMFAKSLVRMFPISIVNRWYWLSQYNMKCEFDGFHGFVGRDSPKDNPTYLKEGSLLTLLEGSLPPCKQALTLCKYVSSKKRSLQCQKTESLLVFILRGSKLLRHKCWPRIPSRGCGALFTFLILF